MPTLATKDLCTGCGVCTTICPRECIAMKKDSIGAYHPIVDEDRCINCHLCEKVCPILVPVEYKYPIKCYAAWNGNEDKRHHSASGGIATVIYEEGLRQGYVCVGASQNEDFSVSLKIATDETELKPFRNSKYVFSEAFEVYSKLKLLLKEGLKAVVVGLPCQIAAFRKMLPDSDNLLLIDLVCHGSVPTTYLQQHIHKLEEQLGIKAQQMSFRAPEKGTATYHFTLYDENGVPFYSKRTVDGDSYNFGFHRAISYRENCYHCRFARPERVSDITLGDYHGLGKMCACGYSEEEVSVILVNTKKGMAFIDEMITNGTIFAEQRPVEEPIQGDLQLQRPSQKSLMRFDFERLILQYNNDFERTIKRVQRNQRIRDGKSTLSSYAKRLLRKIIHK